MAIIWDVTITVVDLSTKQVSVLAVRTDDVAPEDVWTYTTQGSVDTTEHTLAEIRDALVDQIWANWTAYSANQVEIGTLLSGWQAALESDLAAKETP